MTPFRWKNCFADVQTYRHGRTVQSYFDDVIMPALATLQAKIDGLGRSDNAGDVFAQDDMKLVLREAKMAFGLSIQSIWERQLRTYLQGCARELAPNEMLAERIGEANWPALRKLFRRLRGIEMAAFPSFPELDLLQHIGNASRHGDGASAVELYKRAPDLWQTNSPLSEGFAPAGGPPPVSIMDIPVDRLRSFVAAIDVFWADATYIYNESIERKHETLEARLVEERKTRTWRPPAAN
jgi:hypothetical protein